MKKYYYYNGQKQFGPFTLQELTKLNLNENSMIWFEGLDTWKPIKEINELNGLIQEIKIPIPPDIPELIAENNQQTIKANPAKTIIEKPKNWLIESIISSILCCMPFGIIGIIYAIKVNTAFNKGDIEAANRAANTAKIWFIISVVVGMIFLIISTFITIYTSSLLCELY